MMVTVKEIQSLWLGRTMQTHLYKSKSEKSTIYFQGVRLLDRFSRKIRRDSERLVFVMIDLFSNKIRRDRGKFVKKLKDNSASKSPSGL